MHAINDSISLHLYLHSQTDNKTSWQRLFHIQNDIDLFKTTNRQAETFDIYLSFNAVYARLSEVVNIKQYVLEAKPNYTVQ